MPAWLQPALALQECDAQLRALNLRLEMIPKERADLQAESKRLAQTVEEVHQALMQQETRLKLLEKDAAAEDAMIQKLLTQSALIRKQDEYDATMAGIQHAKERRSDLETEELVLMDDIEATQKALAEAKVEDKERQAEIAEEIEGMKQLEVEVKEAKTVKEAERAELKKAVPQEVIGIYERLIQRGKGLPLAPIVDGVCQNCHISVTHQEINDVERGDVVNCNCSAILYLP